jgi:hypothetical protein
MHVPIYPADLVPQKGFKRIAKVIHRDWPGHEPLNLSAAREILARCLGYQDFRDVNRSAEGWSDDASAPKVEDLRPAILVALRAESLSNAIDLERLNAFVGRLPLNVLQTYRLSRANLPEG